MQRDRAVGRSLRGDDLGCVYIQGNMQGESQCCFHDCLQALLPLWQSRRGLRSSRMHGLFARPAQQAVGEYLTAKLCLLLRAHESQPEQQSYTNLFDAPCSSSMRRFNAKKARGRPVPVPMSKAVTPPRARTSWPEPSRKQARLAD